MRNTCEPGGLNETGGLRSDGSKAGLSGTVCDGRKVEVGDSERVEVGDGERAEVGDVRALLSCGRTIPDPYFRFSCLTTSLGHHTIQAYPPTPRCSYGTAA